MKIILLLAIVTLATIELKSTLRVRSFQVQGQAEQTVNDGRSETRAKRQVVRNPNKIWRNGFFYTFNTTERDTQKAFRMGVKVWADNTCINFIEDRTARDKVVVQESAGCSSNPGRAGGDQSLCLREKTEATAVYTIGHALGFYHTMQRYDRDIFVEINMDNIKQKFINDFKKMTLEQAEVYGLTYDYGSIMHYPETGGTANGQPTMFATERNYQKTMGSPIISFSDIFMINKLYGCDERCNKSTSANCANGGFPHPRNCSICICPSGYGGALCDQRPPGCGKNLNATRVTKTLTHRIGYGFGFRDLFDFCNFMITAPEGKKVAVKLHSISLGYDNAGCRIGGVEIKAQQDQKRTGYRFCSVNGSDGVIISSSSRLPIILYNRFTYMDVNMTYRYSY